MFFGFTIISVTPGRTEEADEEDWPSISDPDIWREDVGGGLNRQATDDNRGENRRQGTRNETIGCTQGDKATGMVYASAMVGAACRYL